MAQWKVPAEWCEYYARTLVVEADTKEEAIAKVKRLIEVCDFAEEEYRQETGLVDVYEGEVEEYDEEEVEEDEDLCFVYERAN